MMQNGMSNKNMLVMKISGHCFYLFYMLNWHGLFNVSGEFDSKVFDNKYILIISLIISLSPTLHDYKKYFKRGHFGDFWSLWIWMSTYLPLENGGNITHDPLTTLITIGYCLVSIFFFYSKFVSWYVIDQDSSLV